jgi:hypothetical protein
LRPRPALERLYLYGHPFGDEGLAALVAPPPAAGTPPLPTGGLRKLKTLDLNYSTPGSPGDAGCAALAAALDSGALPALEDLTLVDIPASAGAAAAISPIDAVCVSRVGGAGKVESTRRPSASSSVGKRARPRATLWRHDNRRRDGLAKPLLSRAAGATLVTGLSEATEVVPVYANCKFVIN